MIAGGVDVRMIVVVAGFVTITCNVVKGVRVWQTAVGVTVVTIVGPGTVFVIYARSV